MAPKLAQVGRCSGFLHTSSADNAQKSKLKKEEVTPPPSPKPKPKQVSTTPTPSSAKKVKKEKDTVTYRTLPQDKVPMVPVDVAFEGSSTISKLDNSGVYSHTIKLNATSSFTLTKTVSTTSPFA